MKKAIVLAGGFDQIALIDELKMRGFEVALIDYYENPPAKDSANRHYFGSTLDLDFVRKVARKENPDLITTACTDQALMTAASISEELGLPCYIDANTARNVTNKSYMKNVFMKCNIPTSKYSAVKSLEDLDIIELKFPVMVKPADCNSSKGVKKAIDTVQLREYVKDALNLSRTNTAILEEFKRGREYSADFFIKGGKTTLLSVTESKKIPDNGAFTIAQSLYPVVDSCQFEAIERIGSKIADAFQLKNSPMLVQLIEEEGEFFVLEFSARMGGGSKYKLIEILSGVNIMSEYVNLITGITPTISPIKSDKFVEVDYLYCTPGNYSENIGIETLKKNKVIDYFFQYKTMPSIIEQALTSGDRIGGIVLSGKSKKDLELKRERFNSNFKALDDKGTDIFNHELFRKI